ncbi:MAG TPA: prenyltransferase/squalene oxidase repeat-containing protein [Candidatus Binatia bacterium]|nr:prenyltransferase/squalene oxidase repeat-containing protein [Candidatus Binatia bacterium]
MMAVQQVNDVIDQVTNALLALQNPDGGWGAAQGRGSNTEATALAVSALKSSAEAPADRLLRGTIWLTERQNPNGSWRLNDAATAGSWTTALAIISLSAFPEHQKRVLDGSRWLLSQEGSKPGILAELILWATGRSNVNRLNNDLIGWSWVPNSFSWVEPTSYAITALKKMRSSITESNIAERIQQGEAMIYDRMCNGGGWNYGNSKVLDYALWPYPDITAIALIALQDRAADQANQLSIQTLQKTAAETNSGLACSWAAICLSLYGKDTTDWRRRIEKRFGETGFLGETKTLALGLIALGGKSNPFRI